MLVKNDDVLVTQIKRTVVYGCERYVVSQQTLIEGRSKKKKNSLRAKNALLFCIKKM